MCHELARRGYRVRALARNPDRVTMLSDVPDEICIADAARPGSLAEVCDGVDLVFSSLGGSVLPRRQRPERSFRATDYKANLNLLEAARNANVSKFVYVSVLGAEKLAKLAYVKAHENFVDRLKQSGIDYAVVRPPGFFSAYAMFFEMAVSGGKVVLIGDGKARTNPIHEADLAVACADALTSEEKEIAIGGPIVHSRLEIAEMAFSAIDEPVRIRRVPPWAARTAGVLLRPFWPRGAALSSFYATVSQMDLIGPASGTRTLEAYFDRLAEQKRGADVVVTA